MTDSIEFREKFAFGVRILVWLGHVCIFGRHTPLFICPTCPPLLLSSLSHTPLLLSLLVILTHQDRKAAIESLGQSSQDLYVAASSLVPLEPRAQPT